MGLVAPFCSHATSCGSRAIVRIYIKIRPFRNIVLHNNNYGLLSMDRKPILGKIEHASDNPSTFCGGINIRC